MKKFTFVLVCLLALLVSLTFGSCNGTTDAEAKILQLGQSITYSSNGYKLFSVTPTSAYKSTETNSILVDFTFTPFDAFPYEERHQVGGFLSAVLIDLDTNTKHNNANDSMSGTNKFFIFHTLLEGPKKLYICISSANMYIPFGVYEFTFTL